MRFGNGKTITTRPFGVGYKGAISLAVGQTNRDASLEVVAVPLQGAPATVVILNTRGAILRQWLAYRRAFIGGATVALGDIDGDGLNEIVTGPGSGGGPHIQIFRTDGQAWGGAFFAFDSRETGGARVAIGDIDGDGRAEIIVGSGPGTLPRVQVYDKGRVLRAAFSLGNTPSPVGIRPVVADVDGDGKAEILIPSSAF
jgi:serralysin